MVDGQPGEWRRSSRCVGESHCVEVSFRYQQVLLRNSMQPDVTITFTRDQWRDFLATLEARTGSSG